MFADSHEIDTDEAVDGLAIAVSCSLFPAMMVVELFGVMLVTGSELLIISWQEVKRKPREIHARNMV